ncbi:MAG TPA: glycoside hydrolase, partial [Spirochaetaceae bacterium]|nr:glycoside hydrolase [Spirochaetaceae bacterium]
GDLIMMGDNNEISHVALFSRKEDGRLYFIDATSLTGMVSMRSYPENDQRFIEFRRMNVVRKK